MSSVVSHGPERRAIDRKIAIRNASKLRRKHPLAMWEPGKLSVVGLPSRPGADVFLSYSRVDRPVARKLAIYLQKRGIKVWWDYKLFAGDNFRDRILDELKGARTVLVVWSTSAAKSDFVLDEASRAKKLGKLITTYAPGFDRQDVPLGFGQCHDISVSDRAQIMHALSQYGIAAKTA
jgi:hypothetical protein